MINEVYETQDLLKDNLKKVAFSNNFTERSDIAQEIISRKPDFYERWALLVFFVLLLLLVISTWFIKYPDIILASAVLKGNNAPREIIPRQTGKLMALFVKNNQQVKQGEILGWLESTANVEEVIDLLTRLDSSAKLSGSGNPELIAAQLKRRYTNLGEMQASYQIFFSAWQQYNDYLVNGFYAKKKSMLYGDIASLQNMREKLSAQKDFTSQDNELAKRTFEMNELLFKEKVISVEEYRNAQSTLLNKQKTDPQIDISIISQQYQIRDKQKEIDQLNHDILLQQQTFEQALQTLKSNLSAWLKQYTLQSPIDGTVVFVLPIQQNQYIEQGKLLGFVNPSNSSFFAEVKLPQNNFGKVDTGMKVQLRVDAYPYQETGFIPGTLNYISNISVDSTFLGVVRLDQGLTTNLNRSIQYKSGLKAQAIIITKDMRLLERFYYSIVKAVSVKK